jgi:hypothetical protein
VVRVKLQLSKVRRRRGGGGGGVHVCALIQSVGEGEKQAGVGKLRILTGGCQILPCWVACKSRSS